MAGVSPVSLEYYTHHTEQLLEFYTGLLLAWPEEAPALVKQVQFHARCLRRSDCAEATTEQRGQVFRLLEESAEFLARHYPVQEDPRT